MGLIPVADWPRSPSRAGRCPPRQNGNSYGLGDRLSRAPAQWTVLPSGPPVPANATVALPLLGSLDLLAVEANAQDCNPHRLLRVALQQYVSKALRSARACMPAEASPSMTRFHLRVRSQPRRQAEVLEVLGLEVQRGAPLSPAATNCLLTSMRKDLPQTVPNVSADTLPEFEGDATVLAALKLDPACGL